MSALKITAAAWSALTEHVRAAHPHEAVGLLAGPGDGQVTAARRLPNEAERYATERFRVGHRALADARDALRALDLRDVGVYHSHVGRPAEPSETDLDGATPGVPQVIVATSRSRDGAVEISAVRGWFRGPGRAAVPLVVELGP